MPAHRAANMTKAAINKAVGKNIHELSKAKYKGKGRSRAEIVAIAESEARGGKKKK